MKNNWDQDKGLVFMRTIDSFTSMLLNSKAKQTCHAYQAW